jgi:RNA polymerase sigma-70 factor (ECF subfamily)
MGRMFELSVRSDSAAAEAASGPDACPTWDAAFELYYADLCEYALRLVGSAETAEDLVQDLFLHLWDSRGPRDAARLTKPYLYTATRNRALKYLRRRRVAAAWIERAVHEELPSAESPADLYLRHELEDVVDRALAELPTRCREIFLLRRRDHLSYEEIAAHADVSLGTVKSQMWRAAMLLKGKLAPYLAGALSLIAHAHVDSALH